METEVQEYTVEIIQQLDELLELLNSEKENASGQGFSTITLTHDEVSMITNALTQINQHFDSAGSQ